ncbi:L,D-transpeptidase [Streptomyces sp. NPDC002685]|uniref:L,D-transpeptidase n=1 Tax=Streptomyces sp. NPDC002685 TaxID=3154540 RepID=UPI003317A7CD
MSDELTSDLLELAAESEQQPTLAGADIRGRAVRRRRRRRTALTAAGASVAGALALVAAVSLGGDTDRKPPPAASPTATPSLPAVPDATVDLGRRVVSVAGRRLTLTSDNLTGSTPIVRMTVTAKEATKVIPGRNIGFSGTYELKAPWAIELTAPDGTTDYIAALAYTEKAPVIHDASHGWIGVRLADAKWLYEQLTLGAVVDIKASTSTASPTPTGVDGGSVTAGSGTETRSGTSGG